MHSAAWLMLAGENWRLGIIYDFQGHELWVLMMQ